MLSRCGEGKNKRYPDRVEVRHTIDELGRNLAQEFVEAGGIKTPPSNSFANSLLQALAKKYGWTAPSGCKKNYSSHCFKHGRVWHLTGKGHQHAKVAQAMGMSERAVKVYMVL